MSGERRRLIAERFSVRELVRSDRGRPLLELFGELPADVRAAHVDREAELAWWRAGGQWHVVAAHSEASPFRGVKCQLLLKAANREEAEAVARVALEVKGAIEDYVSRRLARIGRTAGELALAMQAASVILDRYSSR